MTYNQTNNNNQYNKINNKTRTIIIECRALAPLLEIAPYTLQVYLSHYSLLKYTDRIVVQHQKRKDSVLAFKLNPESIDALQKYIAMRCRKKFNIEQVKQYYDDMINHTI